MADQAIDYAALAKDAGAVTTPPSATAAAPSAGLDYAALAKQAGAISSAPAPGASAGTWEDRGVGGKVWHPAAGGSERAREDNSLFGMPPEFAALSGLAIARAVGAPALTAAARAVAGIKATVGQALPAVKYEVTKSTLEGLGVPSSIAVPIAMAVSSYKRGGKAEAAAKPSDVAPPGVDRYMPNVSGVSTSAAEAAPVAAAAAPAAAAVPAAVDEFSVARAARVNTPPTRTAIDGGPVGATKSPQQLLNEAAIGRRRAAYQASLQTAPAPAATEPIVAASGKMKLTADEFKEFTRLTKQGMAFKDAEIAVKAMRELTARFGSLTPSEVAKDIASRGYKS